MGGATAHGRCAEAVEIAVSAANPATAAERIRELIGGGFVVDADGLHAPLQSSDVAVITPHVEQASAIAARLADVPDVLIGTANQLQGLEREAVVVIHPLAGYREAPIFATDLGRLCVALSRHRAHASVVVDFLVAEVLAHIDFLDETIERLSVEIGERERPFEAVLDRLDTISGVGRRTAEIIVAEVGTDVQRFPTAGHLASWAGLCPGQDESAGKRRSGKTRRGNRWLRGALVEAAHSSTRTKTYVAAQFRRLATRHGPKKAMVAVAHSMLRIVHHLLLDEHPFDDLGEAYFDQRQRQQVSRPLKQRLERLGYRVQLSVRVSAIERPSDAQCTSP